MHVRNVWLWCIISVCTALISVARGQPLQVRPIEQEERIWAPSLRHIQQSLQAAYQYCFAFMRDEISTPSTQDIIVGIIWSNATREVCSNDVNAPTNSFPGAFYIQGLPYLSLEKRLGAFIENNNGGRLRFVAVQHFLPAEKGMHGEGFRPFTIYYNVENGKTGRDTFSTWDKPATNVIDTPMMIYSPGPPFYLH